MKNNNSFQEKTWNYEAWSHKKVMEELSRIYRPIYLLKGEVRTTRSILTLPQREKERGIRYNLSTVQHILNHKKKDKQRPNG